jgi:hypothetical protein
MWAMLVPGAQDRTPASGTARTTPMSVRRAGQKHLPKTSAALAPPKPNEVEST